jgi:hypothetical protein
MVERGESMKEDAAAWLPDRLADIADVVITPPTKVFEATATLELGGVQVAMSYHGFGHTDADIVITVGDVAFLGDLVEEGAPPVFDDGYPLSWPGTLRSALDLAPGIIVPGHGDVLDPASAQGQLGEIEAVAVTARRVLDEGLPVEEAARLGPYPAEVMTSALNRALEVRS